VGLAAVVGVVFWGDGAPLPTAGETGVLGLLTAACPGGVPVVGLGLRLGVVATLVLKMRTG
jgi:hypothetical protein